MAILVNKEEKRKEIALSCKELIIEHGIKNITISSIAKTAGIGKGSLYDYFINKEDVVFAVLNELLTEHNIRSDKLKENAQSTKEKVKIMFSFFYDDETHDLRHLYKEFISITLTTNQKEMIEFHTLNFNKYLNDLNTIFKNAILNNEIKEESMNLTKGLFTFADGLFMASINTTTITDLQSDINNHIDAIFKLIEVKK